MWTYLLKGRHRAEMVENEMMFTLDVLRRIDEHQAAWVNKGTTAQ